MASCRTGGFPPWQVLRKESHSRARKSSVPVDLVDSLDRARMKSSQSFWVGMHAVGEHNFDQIAIGVRPSLTDYLQTADW